MVVKLSKRLAMVETKLRKENHYLQIATVTLNDVWAIKFK